MRFTPESAENAPINSLPYFGSGSKHNYVKGWQSTFIKLEQLLGCNT